METAIGIKNLSVAYGQNDAILDLNLEIFKGEFVCVLGPNGAGKTTFLNTVLGFLKCESGKIEIFSKPLGKADAKISYVPQTADIDRNFPITVLDTVMTGFIKKGLHPFKIFSKAERLRAKEILKKVELIDYSKRQISQLSGGEFQRLLIARALCAEPDILLLDEPTSSVDTQSREKIFELLKQINFEGKTVIVVTHDIAAAKKYAEKIIYLNRELIYCGSAAEYKEVE